MGDIYANGKLVAKEGQTSQPVNIDGMIVEVTEHSPVEGGNGFAYVEVHTSLEKLLGGEKLFAPTGHENKFHGIYIRHERG